MAKTRKIKELTCAELRTLVRELADEINGSRHDECYIETRLSPPEDYRCSYCRLVQSLDFED